MISAATETANHAVETFVLNGITVWMLLYFFFAVVDWVHDRPMIGRDDRGNPRAVRAIH